ncbi:fimbria/pilus outer membrane usher protein [Dyella nitratireducens]|uniref:Usher CupB3 n=1 Tax=Dyella nitratireducens TaxID=1849580 RepID=A0ABQ1G0V4_9GAMM|nr:fimbria/pilus outer membrane usher protein [Dyella nitratireducens]GGA34528.1 usher CupB3 [Dyella nitratireducens]GLQ40878.1 usher CupB3 [Dyella nitratireducens]
MQLDAGANGSIADKHAGLRRRLLPALLLSAMAPSAYAALPASPASPVSPAAAEPVNFDASFFPTGMAPKVDLSRFEKGNVVLPGTYRSDIVLNKTWQARTDLVFVNVPGKDSAEPCYDPAMLVRIGVDLKKVLVQKENPSLKKIPEGTFCGPIGDYIPGATADFDMGTQQLSISVPQVYANQAARGYVDPSQWDPGINAGVLNYTTNLYRSTNSGRGQTTGYVGLNASAKLGSWHLYTLGSLSWTDHDGTHYQNTATYLQHDIPSLQAQFEAGDTFTPGDLFDSVRIRGMRLYTDDRMLPQSMRGYAPIVRGIAETNAHVVVQQRGYIIYDANVAPGPFAIEDLYPTGYGGDLDVEVTEADGRVQRFSVPFSSVAQLLRPGQNRWSVTAGKVEQLSLLDTPYVVQGTFQRGINNLVTGYTGATFANGYGAALVGAALNTPVGAVSADITHATNSAPNQAKTHGTSLRVGYNKNITETGTNFAVAAYRYSTKGYVGLQDAISLRDAAARGAAGSNLLRQRSRLDVNVNQSLGDTYGQLFLQGSVADYWAGSGRQVNFSAGYSNHWKSFNYSVNAQRQLVSDNRQFVPGNASADQIPGLASGFNVAQTQGRRDTLLMFTVSVPLGRSDRAPQLTAMVNRDQDGGSNSQATVSGNLGADNRFSYSATAGHTDGSGASGSLNAQYRSPVTQLVGGYSQGSSYRQFNAGASGGVVIHGGGVTFGPPTGDTIGLVQASDASGATVSNSQGAKVDGRGYAIVPNLMPYQLNTIALDPKGADAGLELKSTTTNVAPRAGSVVRLKYDTKHGRAVMVETVLPDGRPVPFGAEVFDAQGNSVGIAGQGSRLFIRDLPGSGVLTVKWGEEATDACQISVQLPEVKKGRQAEMQTVKAACKASMAAITQPEAVQTQPLTSSHVESRERELKDSKAAINDWENIPSANSDERFNVSVKARQ